MAERDPFARRKRDENADDSAFKVEDRRHWAREEDDAETADEPTAPEPEPSVVAELRLRADSAEKKLHEYAAAYRQAQADQERFRERMTRDVERKAQLAFGNLVTDLLDSLDDLDLALAHASDRPEVAPLARGVGMARGRFLSALQKAGIEPLELDGTSFDPNLAEAVRLVPVDSSERNGTVVETLRTGYRLGDRILRPARVAVGRHGD